MLCSMVPRSARVIVRNVRRSRVLLFAISALIAPILLSGCSGASGGDAQNGGDLSSDSANLTPGGAPSSQKTEQLLENAVAEAADSVRFASKKLDALAAGQGMAARSPSGATSPLARSN